MTTDLVLVAVHTGEGTNMTENILQSISKLKGIDIAESELNVRINDKLGEPQDFTTQVESISKARLLALFGCERLYRLQVHVVVEVEII